LAAAVNRQEIFLMDSLRFRLRFFLALMVAVMVLGCLGLMYAEGFSLTDAIYFSVVTVATVGYGDIHPVTTLGKFLALGLIVGGVGAFMGVVATAMELFLSRREKRVRLEKLNMVMGVFFSEVGTELLLRLLMADPVRSELSGKVDLGQMQSERGYAALRKKLAVHPYQIDIDRMEQEDLRQFLISKNDLILRLLENPVLLEHESFTEIIRAVFHLQDELYHRKGMGRLPKADHEHLAGDMKRVYRLLVLQWLEYVRHLKNNYPYLFSLAARMNPFDPDRSPVVQK